MPYSEQGCRWASLSMPIGSLSPAAPTSSLVSELLQSHEPQVAWEATVLDSEHKPKEQIKASATRCIQLGLSQAVSLSEPWNSHHCEDGGYRASTHGCPVREGTFWTRPPLQVTRNSTLSLIWKINQALLSNPGFIVLLKPNIIFIVVYQTWIGSFFCFIKWETILPEAAARAFVPAKKERHGFPAGAPSLSSNLTSQLCPEQTGLREVA